VRPACRPLQRREVHPHGLLLQRRHAALALQAVAGVGRGGG
jgi:hypothetical protein